MLRRLLFAVLASAVLLPAGTAGAAGLGIWNLPEQRTVREAGLLHNYDDQAFHGDRPLAPGQLREAMTTLARHLNPVAPAPVATPAEQVSVRRLDTLLARQLGG
ncbi:MAG: peptidoglycan DL-endopeptidase CwlO, partial [Actinomycetota bacterium]|nr:peptidoglycan DL-endopeptidase CwlO [Actinomycetota bacterium]